MPDSTADEPMRLLPFHEYLALLDGGAASEAAAPSRCNVWLEQARTLWPRLRLGPWNARPRSVEYVARCKGSGALLVHVSANWKDCFVILVVAPQESKASAFMVFDIGAEYGETRFSCPAFGVDEVANEKAIRHCLPRLCGLRDPFALLSAGNGTYLQAYARDETFDVEHQLVTPFAHYTLEARVTADVAVTLFLSYAFGRKEWAREGCWKHTPL